MVNTEIKIFIKANCDNSVCFFYEDIIKMFTIEVQPNGRDTFIVKKTDRLSYHICMTIYNFCEDFDLHYVDIYEGDYV